MRILVTAGPTREPIDAVRFVSNRSSGKVGLALAQACAAVGHETTLLLGPVTTEAVAALNEKAVRIHRFETTLELQRLIRDHWSSHDVLVMTAAVADYRPRSAATGKIPRGGDTIKIELEPTPDLVAAAARAKRPGQFVVAFALEETAVLEPRAAEKLSVKGVDAVVANALETMENDSITPLWLTVSGDREAPGRMSKQAFARWLVKKIDRAVTDASDSDR